MALRLRINFLCCSMGEIIGGVYSGESVGGGRRTIESVSQ